MILFVLAFTLTGSRPGPGEQQSASQDDCGSDQFNRRLRKCVEQGQVGLELEWGGSWGTSSGLAAFFPHGSSHLPSTKRERRAPLFERLPDELFSRRKQFTWWCLVQFDWLISMTVGSEGIYQSVGGTESLSGDGCKRLFGRAGPCAGNRPQGAGSI